MQMFCLATNHNTDQRNRLSPTHNTRVYSICAGLPSHNHRSVGMSITNVFTTDEPESHTGSLIASFRSFWWVNKRQTFIRALCDLIRHHETSSWCPQTLYRHGQHQATPRTLPQAIMGKKARSSISMSMAHSPTNHCNIEHQNTFYFNTM